jgi:hypothetical protein
MFRPFFLGWISVCALSVALVASSGGSTATESDVSSKRGQTGGHSGETSDMSDLFRGAVVLDSAASATPGLGEGGPKARQLTPKISANRSNSSLRAGAIVTSPSPVPRTGKISVLDFGAVGDGIQDDTKDILEAIREAKRRNLKLYFPAGRYRFLGDGVGLDVKRIHLGTNAIFCNDLYSDTVKVWNGHMVGLQQNHLEAKYAGRPIRSGSLTSPPVSTASFDSPVDFIAHWYMDFGLESTRQGKGGITWYDWSWNHHDAAKNSRFQPYDSSRHPWLGFYRGDDPIVLDWICFWLKESGVKAVNLNPSSEIDTARWSQSGDKHHWLYQLFEGVPNFKSLNYILWGYSGSFGAGTDLERAERQRRIRNDWHAIANIYLKYGRFYSLVLNGKKVPVIFTFDMESIRGDFDRYRGSTNTSEFLKEISKRFKAKGYGGVAVFARNASKIDYVIESEGVYIYNAGYNFENCVSRGGSCMFGASTITNLPNTFEVGDQVRLSNSIKGGTLPVASDKSVFRVVARTATTVTLNTTFLATVAGTLTVTPATMAALGNNYGNAFPGMERSVRQRTIPTVVTSAQTKRPHPSTWDISDPSPALFGKLLKKAVDLTGTYTMPKIVQIYNVSEWHEGGPGLIPNMKDGTGYMDQLKAVAEGAR